MTGWVTLSVILTDCNYDNQEITRDILLSEYLHWSRPAPSLISTNYSHHLELSMQYKSLVKRKNIIWFVKGRWWLLNFTQKSIEIKNSEKVVCQGISYMYGLFVLKPSLRYPVAGGWVFTQFNSVSSPPQSWLFQFDLFYLSEVCCKKIIKTW